MILENVDLKKYNTYGIGGICKYMYYPKSINELIDKLNELRCNSESYYILGSGSNVILPDNDYNGTIIKLDKLNNIEYKDNEVTVEAGCFLGTFISDTINHGYVNFTNLFGIPGTIGGAIIGNAGSFKTNIFDYLKSIEVLDNNYNIIKLNKKDIKYDYRYTNLKKLDYIVLSATFILESGNIDEAKEIIKEHIRFRKDNQPLEYKNAGSVFKNPLNMSAGYVIDQLLNMKNYHVGDAYISDKHANFIINKKNAKSSDIIDLINIIKKRAMEEHNIKLELEQKIIKW